jgi:hypothetical protein
MMHEMNSRQKTQVETPLSVLDVVRLAATMIRETPQGRLEVRMGNRYLHIVEAPKGDPLYKTGQMIRVSPAMHPVHGLIVIDSESAKTPIPHALFFRVFRNTEVSTVFLDRVAAEG